jgi:hypothetical protein
MLQDMSCNFQSLGNTGNMGLLPSPSSTDNLLSERSNNESFRNFKSELNCTKPVKLFELISRIPKLVS